MTVKDFFALRSFGYILLVIGAIVSSFLVYTFLLKQPSNDKAWGKQYRILPKISTKGNLLVINDYRDYAYGSGFFYTTRSISISDITKLWFVVEPFGKFAGVAHTYFVFDVKNQEPVVVSVETRRVEGQDFSAFKGVFNNYGLMYVWASERDVTSRRVVEQHNQLFMYPVQIPVEWAQNLFVKLAQKTHELETNPRFYNTFTSNCTSELANVINDIRPGTVPFDISYILTGYSPEFLYKQKYIPHDVPLTQEKARYNITDIVARTYQSPNFSDELRAQLLGQAASR